MNKSHTARIRLAGMIGALLFAVCTAPVFSQSFYYEPQSPKIVSARFAGFGGAYSAMEAGFDTLLTNPAALAYVNSEWSVARLSIAASGPLFDLPSAFQSDDVTQSILDLVSENNGVYMGAAITGPLAFGKVERNFGFGFYNNTISEVDVPSLGSATLVVGEEFLITGGYGLVVYEKDAQTLAIGFQMKGFFQNFAEDSGTTTAILETFTSMNFDSIPVIMSAGIGIDAGAIYHLGSRLSVGIVCKDLYTPVFSTRYANISDYFSGSPNSDTVQNTVKPNLCLGVVAPVSYPARWTAISSWQVMFDYRNALEIFRPLYRNPILNVNLGTELILLDVVSLRFGLHECYPSAGLGLDLTACKIDLAMYGSELGLDPGERPLFNAVFALTFEY